MEQLCLEFPVRLPLSPGPQGILEVISAGVGSCTFCSLSKVVISDLVLRERMHEATIQKLKAELAASEAEVYNFIAGYIGNRFRQVSAETFRKALGKHVLREHEIVMLSEYASEVESFRKHIVNAILIKRFNRKDFESHQRFDVVCKVKGVFETISMRCKQGSSELAIIKLYLC